MPRVFTLSQTPRRIHNVKSAVRYRSSNTEAPSDPVADAIALLRPRTEPQPGLHAAAPWAVRFDAFPYVKIGCVVHGQCWLEVAGHEPTLLQEGDFYLLSAP